MTSLPAFSVRLTRIDPVEGRQIRYLKPDDVCYYLRKYTIGLGFSFNDDNQLIFNLKKAVERRSYRAEWRHKEDAIKQCGRELWSCMNPAWLRQATLVPIPPSCARSDPRYDDRTVRILQAIAERAQFACDIREVIENGKTIEASHSAEKRPRPDQLRRHYRIQKELLQPRPAVVVIVDDIITSGAHFRAAKDMLVEVWPEASIVGLFVARAVRAPGAGPMGEGRR